jgi:hypothetical protein
MPVGGADRRADSRERAMPGDLLTPENTHGFDVESLAVLNKAFGTLLQEYEGRFAPSHIHRVMMTAWTGKTTVQRLVEKTRYEMELE